MPYTRPYASGFVDYPSTTTPINSTALNTMDVGIKTANDQFQTVTTAQRAALSPTVGQAVWDSDLKQLMVYMNASGGNAWQPIGNAIVCTSTTRPSTPFEGQVIRETDTNKEFTYSGSAWVQTNTWGTTSGVTNVSNLIVPPVCRVTRSTTQSILTGNNTDIAFAAGASFDTDSMFSAGADTRITINTAGVYVVSAMVQWASNSTGTRFMSIGTNGGYGGNEMEVGANGGGPTTISVTCAISLAATNYLTLRVYQSSGISINVLYGTLSAVWIGRTS